MPKPVDEIQAHFEARSTKYNRSAKWVEDPDLGKMIVEMGGVKPDYTVLDLACGTGAVSRLFKGKVRFITGLDMTGGMWEQCLQNLDLLVIGNGESMPFPSNSFHLVTVRQGIQFMDAPKAVSEMARTCRSGGTVEVIQLCAYDDAEKAECFEIQRLRNPVRVNYFLEEDLSKLLASVGLTQVKTKPFYSYESVNNWLDNGAIPVERQDEAKAIYRKATEHFLKLHEVRFTDDGDIIDKMKIVIATGVKA